MGLVAALPKLEDASDRTCAKRELLKDEKPVLDVDLTAGLAAMPGVTTCNCLTPLIRGGRLA
jgi:hypothetical protein